MPTSVYMFLSAYYYLRTRKTKRCVYTAITRNGVHKFTFCLTLSKYCALQGSAFPTTTRSIYSTVRYLQDYYSFAPLESKRKTMKSASGKRPPDEAHGPGKEAIRPQQRCLGKSRKEGAHWHAALTAGVGTALIQKIKPVMRGMAPGWYI